MCVRIYDQVLQTYEMAKRLNCFTNVITPAKVLMATSFAVWTNVCCAFLRRLRIYHSAISIELCCFFELTVDCGSASQKKNAVTLIVYNSNFLNSLLKEEK